METESVTTAQKLAQLFARAEANLSKCDASGTAFREARGMFNGHLIQVFLVGWNTATAIRTVSVDKCNRRVTPDEAAQLIAA